MSGCGTTAHVADPQIPTRAKPIEALAPCRAPSPLPADLPAMDTEDALREILENKFHADQVAAECRLKHGALADWIGTD